jgi:hypothetical protein
MNDFVGLAHALQAGAGIGELPPIVRPELMRDGRLVEVMPKWRFETLNLSMVHLGNRYIPRPLRMFKEFATQMAPQIFPKTSSLSRLKFRCLSVIVLVKPATVVQWHRDGFRLYGKYRN